MANYISGIESGTDLSECDVVWSKELVPICRHEPYLSQTTDALDVFPDMVRTKRLDGEIITDVWAEDLTVSQLKALRCRQKTTAPATHRTHIYDGLLQIVTLEEHIQMVLAYTGRVVGIYPELKHSTYFNDLPRFREANTTTMDLLLAVLERYNYKGPIHSEAWRRQPVYIQSFEQDDLVYLAQRTCIPLAQLCGGPGSITADRQKSFDAMTSDESLDGIASYATAFGPWKDSLAAPPVEDIEGRLVDSGLMIRLQQRSLQVHPYTFRPELDQMASVWSGVQADEFKFFLRDLACDALFTDSSVHLAAYLSMEALAGRPWPPDLATRHAQGACKCASSAELERARKHYLLSDALCAAQTCSA